MLTDTRGNALHWVRNARDRVAGISPTAWIAGGGLSILAVLSPILEPPVLLGISVVLLVTAVVFRWPQGATILTVFLIYVNFPAILTKQHGVPGVAAAAFIGLLAVPLASYVFVRGERLRFGVPFGLMLGFLVVLLLSSIGAEDPGAASARVVQYLLEGMLVYWLVINVIRTRWMLKRVAWALLAASALLSVLSVYQDVTGSYRQEFGGLAYRNYIAAEDNPDGGRQKWDRAQGPVNDPNRFGQVLIVILPLCAFFYRNERRRLDRLAAVMAGLLILAGIGVTLSRGAFVTLVVLMILATGLRWMRPRHLVAVFVVAAVSLPALSPHFIPRLLSIVNARYLVAAETSEVMGSDGAMRGRVTSMLVAANMFGDYPILGVGPAQFKVHYTNYSSDPNIALKDIEGTRRAHNLFLEIAAETGLAGLATFLSIVIVILLRLWHVRARLLYRDPEGADIATAFGLAVLGYLGTGMFLHLSYERYYWLLLALAVSAIHVLQAGGQEEPPQPRRHWVGGRQVGGDLPLVHTAADE